MKTIIALAALAVSSGLYAQTKNASKITAPLTQSVAAVNSKLEQDKATIKSMCGVYKVSFNFSETFASDTGYKYFPRYKESGIEYVFIADETPNKISLQHLLIVNDTIIIKHWRQDWVYENTEVYKYFRDNEWIKETLTADQAKGTWTQKVYQVDDSPRYQSYGTWVHVDGKHFWEGTNDAPLPRREYTKRSDYNVLRRHSRMEVFTDGSWALIQDNEKIVRKDGVDKVLCWEKGVEKFSKGNYDAGSAVKYWSKQQQFWADVRKTWDEVYAKTPGLKLEVRVDDKRLYESLFDLADKATEKDYAQGAATPEIKKVIEAFIKI